MFTIYAKVGAVVFGLILASIVINNQVELSREIAQLQREQIVAIPTATITPSATPSATLTPTKALYYYPTRITTPAK